MIQVEWTQVAQADLASIDAHFAAIDPDFAARAGLAALRTARFLADWPHAGSLAGAGTRKKRVAGTPYLLLYRIQGERLQILRVRHSRENWRAAP